MNSLKVLIAHLKEKSLYFPPVKKNDRRKSIKVEDIPGDTAQHLYTLYHTALCEGLIEDTDEGVRLISHGIQTPGSIISLWRFSDYKNPAFVRFFAGHAARSFDLETIKLAEHRLQEHSYSADINLMRRMLNANAVFQNGSPTIDGELPNSTEVVNSIVSDFKVHEYLKEERVVVLKNTRPDFEVIAEVLGLKVYFNIDESVLFLETHRKRFGFDINHCINGEQLRLRMLLLQTDDSDLVEEVRSKPKRVMAEIDEKSGNLKSSLYDILESVNLVKLVHHLSMIDDDELVFIWRIIESNCVIPMGDLVHKSDVLNSLPTYGEFKTFINTYYKPGYGVLNLEEKDSTLPIVRFIRDLRITFDYNKDTREITLLTAVGYIVVPPPEPNVETAPMNTMNFTAQEKDTGSFNVDTHGEFDLGVPSTVDWESFFKVISIIAINAEWRVSTNESREPIMCFGPVSQVAKILSRISHVPNFEKELLGMGIAIENTNDEGFFQFIGNYPSGLLSGEHGGKISIIFESDIDPESLYKWIN